MNRLKKFLLIFILCILLAYVTNLTGIPDNIILFDGENLDLGTMFGIYLQEEEQESIETSNVPENVEIIEQKKITLSLFNIVNVKEVEVTTIPNTTVIPLGNIIGLRLYSTGVLVIGMTEIEGKKPCEGSGIEEGDLITHVNNKRISTTTELTECIKACNGKTMQITYVRDGEEYNTNVEPAQTSNNEYKLGIWVRDGAAGIGTVTYYEAETKKFAALGHGIVDMDTDELIEISSGEVLTTSISKIVQGEEGTPRRD